MQNKIRTIWGTLHPFFENGDVMGRKAANSAFLQTLLDLDPFDEYHFFLHDGFDPDEMRSKLDFFAFAPWREERVFIRTLRELPAALSKTPFHCFHLSDPVSNFSDLQMLRNHYACAPFPITAPVHSMSYNAMGPSFLQHIWPGTTPQDAIIVTSRSAKTVMERFYGMLRKNYRLPSECFFQPALEHIPLGVDHSSMPSPEEKCHLGAQLRRELGLAADTVVFLVFARLSYQAKMDFLPVLRACKEAECIGLQPGTYHVILAGWSTESDKDFLEKYKCFARNLKIGLTVFECPTAKKRLEIYAAADVFLSPSDNMQETFGLTLLEAAAAGLPVIASDYDGYKDLVLPGKTGFLIRTIGPDVAEDSNWRSHALLALETLALFAQQTAVDIPEMARSMTLLAHNPEKRRAMGAAGRLFSLGFSWRSVLERYVKVWDDLAARAVTDFEALRTVMHPLGVDYTNIFGDYVTERLSGLIERSAVVRLTPSGEAVMHEKDFPVIYEVVERHISPDKLHEVLFRARKPVPVGDLAKCSAAAAGDSGFLLLWAMKQGYISCD